MAGTMFTEVVCPHRTRTGRPYTIVLSVIVHASVFAIAIVAPLIATTELPSPPDSVLPYITASMLPSPPPVARPARRVESETTISRSPVAPVEAPSAIGVETGIVPNGGVVETGTVDGLLDGFAGGGLLVEVPPPAPAPLQPVRPGGNVTPGRVEQARVIRSLPLLDQAALDAVRGWEYSPTLLNGRPTPVIMTVTVQFTLK